MDAPSNWIARNRRIILYAGVSAIALWYVFLLATLVFLPVLKSGVRARAADLLQREFGGHVQFRSFEVTFLPTMRVVAQGVLIGNDGRLPLVQVGAVDTVSSFIPWHIRTVRAHGVWLNVPTRMPAAAKSSKPIFSVTAHDVLVTNARVDLLPSTGQVEPLHFSFAQLHISDFNLNRSSNFEGLMKISQPGTTVQISGHAGPWNTANPSLTNLDGSYSLDGVSRTVAAHGEFRGPLQQIAVTGNLTASDFRLKPNGIHEPLQVNFQACLNGLDSSLDVQHINGKLQQTPFQGTARIENVEDERLGKISSNLSIDGGRLEDVLPLFVNSRTSPIRGPFQLRAQVAVRSGEALPGGQNLMDAVGMNGDFAAEHARFASLDLRDQIRKLTRKASGHPQDKAAGTSMFSMQGHVQLAGGTVRLTDLRLRVPDAGTHLNGTYQLASGKIDLKGDLWMDAKLSNTTTGAKRLLLKIADPFFRNRRGGAKLPIRISGTDSDPHFSLNLAPPMLTARSRSRRVLFSH